MTTQARRAAPVLDFNWMAELWVLGLSRKREYWADAVGAALTTTDAMKSALVKIYETPAELTAYESCNARLMFRGKGSAPADPTFKEALARYYGGVEDPRPLGLLGDA